MTRRRVVVSGVGMLTPLGNTVSESWEGAREGRSGAATIDSFDVADYSVRFSASVKNFSPGDYMDPKEARRIDAFIQYGLAAGYEAVADAGIEDCRDIGDRIGVAIGSGIGGIITIENTRDTLTKSGPRRVSPFFVPSSIINMISGKLSIKYGFRGPNFAIVTACTTGTHNIGMAARLIQWGEADVMVAGGAEMATSPVGLAAFASMKALSSRNGSSKPMPPP